MHGPRVIPMFGRMESIKQAGEAIGSNASLTQTLAARRPSKSTNMSRNLSVAIGTWPHSARLPSVSHFGPPYGLTELTSRRCDSPATAISGDQLAPETFIASVWARNRIENTSAHKARPQYVLTCGLATWTRHLDWIAISLRSWKHT